MLGAHSALPTRGLARSTQEPPYPDQFPHAPLRAGPLWPRLSGCCKQSEEADVGGCPAALHGLLSPLSQSAAVPGTAGARCRGPALSLPEMTGSGAGLSLATQGGRGSDPSRAGPAPRAGSAPALPPSLAAQSLSDRFFPLI